jgi:chaperone required for assembly of F1-ATPase
VLVAPYASPLEGEADFFAAAKKSVGGTPPRTADAVRPSLKGRVGSFCILLDGKVLRTPARAEFVVPNEVLANAIAEEWRGQGETLQPDTMPLTRLANTALDRIAPRRTEALAQIMRFAQSDLVCYRAEHPADLAAHQARAWDPLIAWARDSYGAALKTGTGIAHVPQEQKTLDALERAIATHDDFALAALHVAATTTGSAVIALAFLGGRLDAEGAFAAAHLDDAYQAERWGTDAVAQASAARVAAELIAAERFLALLKKS